MTLTDLVRSLPVARDIVQSAASVLQLPADAIPSP
jgi:hypothetical protein